MLKTGSQRGFSALALLKMSERDLKSFHDAIQGMTASHFLEFVRDLEDELENSTSMLLEQTIEQSYSDSEHKSFYRELDTIRKKDLGVSVHVFAELLTESLKHNLERELIEIPIFDSRRGIQSWIGRLLKRVPESELYHAVMRIKHERNDGKHSDWKLR